MEDNRARRPTTGHFSDAPRKPVTLPKVNFAASEDKRRNMREPGPIDESGIQNYSGAKPTRGLYRKGERIA